MNRVALLLLIALLAGSCGPSPPLDHALPSAERLASAVLEALARSDRSALERLAVDRDEFERYVWPELPAARPERNLTLDYVWGDLSQKSRLGLLATLNRHGNQRYELVSVRFDGPTSRYAVAEVHRGTVLTVRGPAGQQLQLRLYGSSYSRNGKWKVFSYVVD